MPLFGKNRGALICSLALISEKRVCSLARSLPLYKMRFARSFDLLLARLLVILILTECIYFCTCIGVLGEIVVLHGEGKGVNIKERKSFNKPIVSTLRESS